MDWKFPEWCNLDFLQNTLFKNLTEYKTFRYSEFLSVLTDQQKSDVEMHFQIMFTNFHSSEHDPARVDEALGAYWNLCFFNILYPCENFLPSYCGIYNLQKLLDLYEKCTIDYQYQINIFWFQRTSLLQFISGLFDPLGEVGYLNYPGTLQYMLDYQVMNKLIFDVDGLLSEVQAKFSNM